MQQRERDRMEHQHKYKSPKKIGLMQYESQKLQVLKRSSTLKVKSPLGWKSLLRKCQALDKKSQPDKGCLSLYEK